jgi:hypothetical protein
MAASRIARGIPRPFRDHASKEKVSGETVFASPENQVASPSRAWHLAHGLHDRVDHFLGVAKQHRCIGPKK